MLNFVGYLALILILSTAKPEKAEIQWDHFIISMMAE
jgi:hypothetical protein